MPHRKRSSLLAAACHWLTWFNVAMLALLWVGISHNLNVRYETEQRSAKRNVSNLSGIFAEHVSRSIREADKTLLLLRSAWEATPDSFDLQSWVGKIEFRSDIAVQFALIGADGLMLASNIGPTNSRVDLSDREHFRVHLDNPADALFISKPVLGRQSGKWSIQLSRKMTDREGNFAGVLVSSLNPYHLAKFYESVDLGLNGAITLVGFDGIIRARGGMSAETLGKSMSGSEVLNLYTQAPTGILMGSGVIDGVRRLLSYNVIAGYPLIVVAAMSESEILFDYEQEKRVYLLAGSVITAFLVFMIGIGLRDRVRLDATLADLQVERDNAQRASQAKSTFLAMMSHEIRTPLNGVLGLTNAILGTRLTDEQRTTIKTIQESGDSLLEILNDILDYSKLEAGQLSVENIAFKPADIAFSIQSVIGPRAKAKGLEFVVETDPSIPAAVIGDPGRLRQILLNLVSNAVKFTSQGRVSICCRCVDRNAEKVMLEWVVTDTGIGIPPERLPSLFQDFVQADSTIHRRFGGSGLGLSISKRIVQTLGGEIAAESELGRGTSMRFKAPLIVTEAPLPVDLSGVDRDSEEQLSEAIARLGRPLKILIADDNSTNRLVAAKMLHGLDVETVMAADGMDVIAADCSRFDVILMDLSMPEMDGLEATKIIRERGIATPVIAFTANAFQDDIERCKAAGMSEFLAKPARKSALVSAILRSISKQHEVRSASPIETRPDDELDGGMAAVALFDKQSFYALAEELGSDGMDEAFQFFLDETTERLQKLRKLDCNVDRAAIRREAHTIKGTAATFGFQRMSHGAMKLEKMAATIDAPGLVKAIRSIEKAFEEVRLIAPRPM